MKFTMVAGSALPNAVLAFKNFSNSLQFLLQWFKFCGMDFPSKCLCSWEERMRIRKNSIYLLATVALLGLQAGSLYAQEPQTGGTLRILATGERIIWTPRSPAWFRPTISCARSPGN
jgi:hypothetical protein